MFNVMDEFMKQFEFVIAVITTRRTKETNFSMEMLPL